MLAITETAAQAISTLLTSSELPAGAGLRIASQPGGEPEMLELSVARAPGEQDMVLHGGGATVFLEPGAARTLDDKILDVQRVMEGDQERYRFAIAPRPPATGPAPAGPATAG